MNIRVEPPAIGWREDWRDYLPLVKAETSKFYKKQERGKFRYDDLLAVGVEALENASKTFDRTRNNGLTAYALKGIRGALNDYVRDAYKVVGDVEMWEADYLAAYGEADDNKPHPKIILKQYVKAGVRYAFYAPGLYRTNAQLLRGSYKVNSRHAKVKVAPRQSTYKDGWGQVNGGWKRAKIDDEHDAGGYDPSVMASINAELSRGFVSAAELRAENKDEQDAIDYEIKHGGPRREIEEARRGRPIGESQPVSNLPISCGCTVPVGHFARHGGEGSIRKPAAGNGPETRKYRGGIMSLQRGGVGPNPLPWPIGSWQHEIYLALLSGGGVDLARHERLYASIYERSYAKMSAVEKLMVADQRLLFGRGPTWHREAGYFDVEWGRQIGCGPVNGATTG